ncbi:MAG: heavy metal translocating P-type ATPase [Clostridia bacterium]|nr:heavy metal translocating P-type ATPase [Clostridia bacterium]
MNSYKYTIDGLDCAACALKVEDAIRKIDEIESVTLNFSTQTLMVKSSADFEELIPLMEKAALSVEDGVSIKKYSKHNEHHHHEHCDCGCDEHEHHHEHSHKHSDDEKKKTKINWELIEIIVAVVFLLSGIALNFVNIPQWISNVFMAVSAAVSGYRIVIKGIKSVIKLKLDENVLTAVAVIAAAVIGEFFEAAAVTVLFSIGEMLEEKAVDTSRRSIKELSSIRADMAHIIMADGTVRTTDAENVEVGTEILVKPYERIPIDGVISDGSSSIDTSAITGESIPSNVSVGDSVLSGMMNINGVLKIRTTKACEESAAARILHLVEESAAQKGNAENFITRFAKVYTPVVFILALLVCVVPPLFNLGTFLDWLNRALVFLVASCPCALVISVPLAFYSGIGACSKVGVLIKGGKFIEAISKAQSIAFDKTGTLTSGELNVTKITAENGFSEEDVIRIAAAAEQHSSHPAALAIKNKAVGYELPKLENIREKAGYGVSAVYNGKEILCGNKRLFKDDTLENGIIYLSVGGKMVGKIYIEDTIRFDTSNTLNKLRSLGFKHIVMLTGDGEKNASAIAKNCGLTEYKSSLLPENKADEVDKLQKNGGVIFVGDGINDAPVLAKSNCGFAMGLGSEAAIESADAVLVGGTLAQLPEAVKISRQTMSVVRFNITFALIIKAVILVLAVIGIAPMWLAVFTDTGVLIITVLNTVRLLRRKNNITKNK